MAKNKKKKTAAANQVSPFANVLLNIALLIGVLICIYPVLQVIGISFSDNEAVKRTGYSIIPKVFSLTGYQYVFSASGAIVKAYGVTIFATVVGTLIHVIMVSMFAYPLTRPEFAYRNFYMLFILVPTLFSGGMVPWYIVCTQLLHLKIPFGHSLYHSCLTAGIRLCFVLSLKIPYRIH